MSGAGTELGVAVTADSGIAAFLSVISPVRQPGVRRIVDLMRNDRSGGAGRLPLGSACAAGGFTMAVVPVVCRLRSGGQYMTG